MCVHLFGGVSSPNSSNYALRKAAVDSYGSDTAATIMTNFQVDDLPAQIN